MTTGERAWQLLPELTKFNSISATPGEGAIAREIHAILSNHRYFQTNPDLLVLRPLPGSGKPAIVAGLVRGMGNNTVILLNHHDVVDVEGYGQYKHLAFSPHGLTKALNPAHLPDQVRKDWESGQWLLGRGTMDMLYGLALQLALTEKLADNLCHGNLVFLSVPDEENNSLGMRHAVALLREFQDRYSLKYIAAVNSEPHDTKAGAHVIQTGSDGKLLPLIYCRGQETHAGAIFKGLNPHLLLAEIIRRLELSLDFVDNCAGEHTLPPTVLRAGDNKQGYNVSTPLAAWAFVNIFTLATPPEEVVERICSLAREAFAATLARLEHTARRWPGSVDPPEFTPSILTFASLWQQCLDQHGQKFTRHIDAFANDLGQTGADQQQFTLAMVEEVHKFCPDQGPKVIIALAPPFYPPVRNRRQTAKEQAVMAAIASLTPRAAQMGIALEHEEYHRGISDLSYCMLQDAEKTVDFIQANCPAWGRTYHLPLADIAQLDAPVINLGPWGRGVHTPWERLNIPFAREILPDLLETLVLTLLQGA